MKEKKTFREITRAFGIRLINGMRRYPVAIGMAMAASVIGVVLVHNENFNNDTKRLLASFIMALVLGLIFSLVLKTIIENNGSSFRMVAFFWIVLGTGTLLYSMYLYTFLENMETIEAMRFAAFILVGFVLFMTAVFRKKTEFQEVYSTLVGWRLAITTIYTLIIWGGISLILFAIDRLLNINIDEELYMDTIILAAGFFAPMFFFGGVPKTEDKLTKEKIYKFFRILILYVIAPLLSAYTVVFYIYSLRILFTWDWPDGLVGNMVLWYALIGTVTMYFLHGMDDDSKWASIFGRWFPRVVILPLILLFISLGIRINAYGFTPVRYLLGATGIWMLGCAVYMSIVNYKKRCTRVITVSLVIIALFSMVGPWSAINIGRISQINRLEKLLVENNMLLNGSLVQNTGLSEETKGKISDKVDYLENEYNSKGMDFLPEDFEIRDMKKVFGFDYTYYYDDPYMDKVNPRNVSIRQDTLNLIIDVRGYDYIWDSENWDIDYIETANGKLSLEYIRDQDTNNLNIFLNDNLIYNKKLDTFLEKIQSEWDEKGSDIDIADLTFTEETADMSLKYVFVGVEMFPDSKGFELGWVRYFILIKLK